MAIEYPSPALSVIEKKAVISVSHWLGGEHAYQFHKNRITHSAHPANSMMYILTTEIPNKWHRFQHFRDMALDDKKRFPKEHIDTKLLMQIGQNILKCAAAARGAYVWSEIKNGSKPADASGETWKDLKAIKQDLICGKKPLPRVELLGGSVEDAVKAYEDDQEAYGKNPSKTFDALTCLAIQGVLEYQDPRKPLVLPAPGVESGRLVEWDYVPKLMNH